MVLSWSILASAVAALFAYQCLRLVWSLRSPTRAIPGPFLARFTKLWYLRQIAKGDFHSTNIELHRQKGPIVRIAPGFYSLSDPECLKTIYGYGANYIKSSWYDAWNFKDDITLTNMFSERDTQKHAAGRRKVANMYSMTALTAYEPFVDNCIGILRKHLDNAASSLSTIDLAHWSQCYAFDVIGEITFGKRFGFLDRFEDVNHIIAALDNALGASSWVGLFLWVRPLLFFALRVSGQLNNDAVTEFAERHINAIASEKSSSQGDRAETGTPMAKKFVEAQRAQPGVFTDWDIMSNVASNIGAGSDTTAISLSATFYFTYKNPGTLQKLREELKSADLGDSPSFKDAQKLPYLQAVMKEALRMHPGTGLPLFREVPAGGAVISGQFFPEKSNVGVNTWIIHRNKEIFGADADIFRPERWLEADESQKAVMERNYIPFGVGSRTCIGKNISLLEMNKLVPIVIRDYDMEVLDQPKVVMKAWNHWFVKPVDFKVRISKRK